MKTKLLSMIHEGTAFAAHRYPLMAAFAVQSYFQTRGDFLEFGLFRGDGLLRAHQYIASVIHHYGEERAGHLRDMRLVGFDSFAGLPTPSEGDAAPFMPEGHYACSREEVEARLRKGGLDLRRVALVEGFYEHSLGPETKARLGLRSASIVHIDCDYYESARRALAFVTDLLVDGTIIVFDDWWIYRGHPDRGEPRAFREWVEENDLRTSPMITSTAVSYVVHR